MKAAGIIRGAYHFWDSRREPVAQAAYFANYVGRLGILLVERTTSSFTNSSMGVSGKT